MLSHRGKIASRFLYISRTIPLASRAWLKAPSRRSHSWSSLVSAPVQSYVSTSHDPFLNLSIEHYLLQNSPPESAVLFIYQNRPCVVFGRNQNPWLELNLPTCLDVQEQGHLEIVRRRSGGGTVYHDRANVNWTVISPPKTFTRDKHAEMVVRALRKLGVERARVNERHDIVLDQGSDRRDGVNEDDTHRTPWTASDGSSPLKCSGSAYKLTRQRALHHGTCLLNSKMLRLMENLLSSPAKGYITAKGVESVSSPVGNTGVEFEAFVEAVQKEFSRLYSDVTEHVEVGQDALTEPDVNKGMQELLTPQWIYGQTPQFTVSSQRQSGMESHSDWVSIPDMPLDLTVRHGIITQAKYRMSGERAGVLGGKVEELLHGQSLYDPRDWMEVLRATLNESEVRDSMRMLQFLMKVLPIAYKTP